MQYVKLEFIAPIVIFAGTVMIYMVMIFVRRKNGLSFLLVKNQKDDIGKRATEINLSCSFR